MKLTKQQLIAVARLEIREWVGMPHGVALAILWAYIERVCNGEPIEDTFFGGKQQQSDYEI